ncbi:NAD-dependent deacylase [Brevundimonas vesicularis]|uniref:NAD-dependent deacylase n=1 Tax=Brevundimonas vesicularis TaxID=41276 RepID=UPI0038D3C83D
MNLVVLTGAGISAESGVPTFRASDGLWEGHRIEEVATPEGFHTNPAMVQQFYNIRRKALAEVHPNAAHLALAELAARWDGNFLLVTQNVDDLHDRAHARIKPADGFELIHMHGELLKARCTASGMVMDWEGDLEPRQASPYHEMGWMRPHIVWFGEMPLQMGPIEQALADCDVFLSIGTSGNVYPAAGFVELARDVGARTVEINLEPTLGRNLFAEHVYGPATKVLPDFLASL